MVSTAPFHSIIEVGTKLLPDAVTVSVALPAVAEFGLTPLNAGIGFCDSEEPPCDPPPLPQPSPRQRNKDRKERYFRHISQVKFAPKCKVIIHDRT